MNVAADPKAPTASPLLAMTEKNGVEAPEVPCDLKATGLDHGFLADPALTTANQVRQCSTKWVASQMRLLAWTSYFGTKRVELDG
jgi:hypothetical protein